MSSLPRSGRMRTLVYITRAIHAYPRKRVFIERRRSTIRRRELFRRLRVTRLLEIDDGADRFLTARARYRRRRRRRCRHRRRFSVPLSILDIAANSHENDFSNDFRDYE